MRDRERNVHEGSIKVREVRERSLSIRKYLTLNEPPPKKAWRTTTGTAGGIIAAISTRKRGGPLAVMAANFKLLIFSILKHDFFIC